MPSAATTNPLTNLLKRILAERRARGKMEKRRRRKYKEPDPPDTSALPGLAWRDGYGAKSARALRCTNWIYTQKARPDYWNGDFPWVTSTVD